MSRRSYDGAEFLGSGMSRPPRGLGKRRVFVFGPLLWAFWQVWGALIFGGQQ